MEAPPFVRSQGTEPPAEPDRLVSKEEVLQILGVTYPTVWRFVHEGKFPPGRYVGTRVFWRMSEVNAFIESLPRQAARGMAPAFRGPDRSRTMIVAKSK